VALLKAIALQKYVMGSYFYAWEYEKQLSPIPDWKITVPKAHQNRKKPF
jgi:hypothetical protein